MNQIDVVEAVAATLAELWPERMIYRDFCPADFQRPSAFLYVRDAGYEDAALGLVEWSVEIDLELFSATDAYSVASTEALRAEQAAVLERFPGPGLAVGDRHIMFSARADTPGPGAAAVTFFARWMDRRPGYTDPNTGEGGHDVPAMEHFAVRVTEQKG